MRFTNFVVNPAAINDLFVHIDASDIRTMHRYSDQAWGIEAQVAAPEYCYVKSGLATIDNDAGRYCLALNSSGIAFRNHNAREWNFMLGGEDFTLAIVSKHQDTLNNDLVLLNTTGWSGGIKISITKDMHLKWIYYVGKQRIASCTTPLIGSMRTFTILIIRYRAHDRSLTIDVNGIRSETTLRKTPYDVSARVVNSARPSIHMSDDKMAISRFGELIVWKRRLSETEHNIVMRELKRKWNTITLTK